MPLLPIFASPRDTAG